LTVVIIIFGLRWFFRTRRALRRKRGYSLETERFRMPIR